MHQHKGAPGLEKMVASSPELWVRLHNLATGPLELSLSLRASEQEL